ncbi:MAG: hypothetical protein Q9166_007489 [cf. Caloplaca sp. 2 TL-2023]
MTQKRKTRPSATNGHQSKRHHHDEDEEIQEIANSSSKVQVDPTYGQRSAFPGLDALAGENDLFYGPAEDGLDYLRMVRSEAKSVPNLLTATRATELDIYQDYPQGYYEDGAYTAVALSSVQRETQVDEKDDLDPQEAYYTSLCEHFQALRTPLHSLSPPPTASNESIVTIATKLNDGASSRVWRMTLLYTQPATSILYQLNQETVITGIAALEKYMSWNALERESYLGPWAWGLLARCREVGMMGSEEVGVIRDLGKKAKGMIRALAAGLGMGQETHNMEAEEDGVMEEVEEDDDVRKGGDRGHEEVVGSGENRDGVDIDEVDAHGLHLNNSANGMMSDQTGPSPKQKSSDGTIMELRDSTLAIDEIAEVEEYLRATLPKSTPPNLSDGPIPISEHINTAESHLQSTRPDPQANPSPPVPQSDPNPVFNTSPENVIPLTSRISATLDVIVTIVGEAYGQRDLLEGRMVWD